ncbi:putative papilin isoform X9 [Penaeus vannamei]|uniref:Putative papilin isoform X9 n=1 Tax=Penaeus vannamei TaxID=6689 RepID=A0A423SEY8_PENVA|nr:putative papilin isoform X9 [Penaeus vannamei]
MSSVAKTWYCCFRLLSSEPDAPDEATADNDSRTTMSLLSPPNPDTLSSGSRQAASVGSAGNTAAAGALAAGEDTNRVLCMAGGMPWRLAVMLVWALFFASLTAAAESDSSSALVAKLTVAKLKEAMKEVVTEVLNQRDRSARNNAATEIPLHNNCTDSSEYNDCHLVVRKNLCNNTEYFARYCCRSCTLAKQLPTYGPHLRHVAEAPIVATIQRGKTVFPRGAKVTVDCDVAGYPAPEVVWMRTNYTITSSDKYQLKVRATPGTLIQKLQAELSIKDFSNDDMGIYTCMAISRVGLTKTSIYLSQEFPVQAEITTEVITYPVGDDITLNCQVKSYMPSTIAWYNGEEPIVESEKFKVVDRKMKENTFEVLRSRLTIVNAQKKDSGHYVCRAANEEGIARSSKKIFVSDAVIHPNCTDIADSKECSNDYSRCSHQEYVAKYCCRTCTMTGILPPWGQHLMTDAKAPLEVDITPPWGTFPYDSEVELHCTGGSYPNKPNIRWMKDETPIQESDKYQIKEEVLQRSFKVQVVSVLRIANVRVSDSGRYRCVASRGSEVNEDSGLLARHDS